MPPRRPYTAIAKFRLAGLTSAIAAGLPVHETSDETAVVPTGARRLIHGRQPEIVLLETAERAQRAKIPVRKQRARQIGPGQYVAIVLDNVLDPVRGGASFGHEWIEEETSAIAAAYGEAVRSIFVVLRADGTLLLRAILVPVEASMRASVLVDAYRARPDRAPSARAGSHRDTAGRSRFHGVATGTTRIRNAEGDAFIRQHDQSMPEEPSSDDGCRHSAEPLPSPRAATSDPFSIGDDLSAWPFTNAAEEAHLPCHGRALALSGPGCFASEAGIGAIPYRSNCPGNGPSSPTSSWAIGDLDSAGKTPTSTKDERPFDEHSAVAGVPSTAAGLLRAAFALAPSLLISNAKPFRRRLHADVIGAVERIRQPLDRLAPRLVHADHRYREKAFQQSGIGETACWLRILPPQPFPSKK